MAVFATSISAIIAPMVSGSLRRIMSEKRKQMKRSNHYIIVRVTPLALNTYRELKRRQQIVTIILPQPLAGGDELDEEDVIIGDANSLDVLRQADADQATAVLAMRADDSENAFIVLAVKELKGKARTVAAINDTEYGLAAGVWTADERRGWSIARRLRAGSVAVNEAYVVPWGAVGAPQSGWGSSGLGARHGHEAIQAVTRVQTIALQHGTHGLVGGRGPAIGLDRLFALGGDVMTPLYTGALRAMRALRLP